MSASAAGAKHFYGFPQNFFFFFWFSATFFVLFCLSAINIMPRLIRLGLSSKNCWVPFSMTLLNYSVLCILSLNCSCDECSHVLLWKVPWLSGPWGTLGASVRLDFTESSQSSPAFLYPLPSSYLQYSEEINNVSLRIEILFRVLSQVYFWADKHLKMTIPEGRSYKEAPIYFSNIFISFLGLAYFSPLGCPPRFQIFLALFRDHWAFCTQK